MRYPVARFSDVFYTECGSTGHLTYFHLGHGGFDRMENTPHKISVRIGGMSYNLVSSEAESYTRQVAARADEMIRRVASSNPQLSQHMATVLALTNAVDETMRLSRHQTLAEQQRDTAEMKTTELRTELAREREVNWELKKELLHLRTLLKNQPIVTTDAIDTVPADEPPQPKAVPEKPKTNTREPNTAKAFGDFRQTGLDEYLEMHNQSNSYIVVTPFDDEP